MEEKKIDAVEKRYGSFYDIFGIAAGGRDTTVPDPLFSNDILDFWSPLGTLPHTEGDYEAGLCRIKAPFSEFDRMERHLESAEIIVPLRDDLFIPVAPPGDGLSPADIRIVPVRAGEVIQLHAGVWHFACGPIDEGSLPLDYLVLLERGTPTSDLEMRELGKTVKIVTG
jgi:hypothetical protein